jgi:diguanylate cyclase (GGDEF)-like protein/PAS domain S-box-containing protein
VSRPPISVTSRISWIAGAISLIVAASLPLGFGALSYQNQTGAIGAESHFNASLVSDFVAHNPDNWQFQSQRIAEFLIERDRTGTDYPELRRLLSPDGELIASSSATVLSAPVLARSSPVMDRGDVVAHFEVARSIRPLLIETGLVALLGMLLASILFYSLKTFPLRALNRALADLHQSEQLFSKAFHASPDPVMICRADNGQIISVNTSFLKLTGYASSDVVNRTYAELGFWADENKTEWAKQQLGLGQTVNNLEMALVTLSGEHRDMLVSFEITEINNDRCVLTVARDVTEQKRTEQIMSYLANYDQLTGLPNRELFRDRLEGAMQRAQRAERLVALLYLDLDRFKRVNDSLGHQAGDQLLTQVAERLQRCVRRTDTIAHPEMHSELPGSTVARLGGDEFTVVLGDLKHVDEISRVAQRIISALSTAFDLAGHQVFVGASIGITVYPFDDIDLDNMIRNADAAMYQAKAMGRNNFQFYTDDLNANAEERLWLETELRQALERNQFELVYQPKLDLHSNRISGVEALLRWNSPEMGQVSPLEFIPLLEDTGLIVPIGAWVLQTACAQAAAWRRAGMNLTMAVNLSPRQFHDDDLTGIIQAALDHSGLPAKQLELEVTESLLMEDSTRSQTTLASIKQMGIHISVDDFGTGYSSLAYLKRFPLDTLKIDRTFVKEVGIDSDDTAIVRAVIALARSLRLTVVAEGVETQEQLAFLRETRCEQAQGYLISRPLDGASFEAWLAEYDGTGDPSPEMAAEAVGQG